MAFTRSLQVATLGLVLAGTLATLPAMADDTTTVTFQPGSHWAQEVNTITNDTLQQDYSVAVAAEQTLQVNLITRNPNLFFKIKNETSGKDLVDTLKTGATTWSTHNATAATYRIRVYAQDDALQRGVKAKYALQIGQYGKSDLHPVATKLTFQPTSPWVQESSTLDASASEADYTVTATAGQTLAVNLVTQNPKVHFKVVDQANNQTLVDSGSGPVAKWTTPVTAAATYTISVYANPADLAPGSRAGFVVQVGLYTQGGAQAAPAAAGTAATPASATSSTP